MSDDDQVTLESQDQQSFAVEVKVAKMSETIKNLIEDAGVDNPIPLPNVTGKILAKVVEYCKYHTEHPTAVSEDKKDEKRTDDIIGWDLDFCKVDQATLFELILAANYLDIKVRARGGGVGARPCVVLTHHVLQDLLDLTCKTVANMIKGKTPEEIRKTFNIKNDFTPEEEEQVRKENEWCEER